MPTPTAGQLDTRALLSARTLAVGQPAGDRARVFTPVTTVWASVTGLVGTEREQADAVRARARYRLVIRRGPQVAPTWRVNVRGLALDVETVTDWRDAGGHYLTLDCRQASP